MYIHVHVSANVVRAIVSTLAADEGLAAVLSDSGSRVSLAFVSCSLFTCTHMCVCVCVCVCCIHVHVVHTRMYMYMYMYMYCCSTYIFVYVCTYTGGTLYLNSPCLCVHYSPPQQDDLTATVGSAAGREEWVVKVDLNKPVHDFHEKIPRMAISVSICILFVHSANSTARYSCTYMYRYMPAHNIHVHVHVCALNIRLIKSRAILGLLTIVLRL